MSTPGFVFKQLRNDRERTIYLEAFWEGVYASADIALEMNNLEKEWERGRLNQVLQTPVQRDTSEIPQSRTVVRFPAKNG